MPHIHMWPPICRVCFRFYIRSEDTVIRSNECYCFSKELKSSNEYTKHLSNDLRLEVKATRLVRTLKEIWAMDRWIGFPMSVELETNLSWFHQPWRSLGWCSITDRSHLGCPKMVNGEDYKGLVFSKWTQPSTCSHIVWLIHLVISDTVKSVII